MAKTRCTQLIRTCLKSRLAFALPVMTLLKSPQMSAPAVRKFSISDDHEASAPTSFDETFRVSGPYIRLHQSPSVSSPPGRRSSGLKTIIRPEKPLKSLWSYQETRCSARFWLGGPKETRDRLELGAATYTTRSGHVIQCGPPFPAYISSAAKQSRDSP